MLYGDLMIFILQTLFYLVYSTLKLTITENFLHFYILEKHHLA